MWCGVASLPKQFYVPVLRFLGWLGRVDKEEEGEESERRMAGLAFRGFGGAPLSPQ